MHTFIYSIEKYDRWKNTGEPISIEIEAKDFEEANEIAEYIKNKEVRDFRTKMKAAGTFVPRKFKFHLGLVSSTQYVDVAAKLKLVDAFSKSITKIDRNNSSYGNYNRQSGLQKYRQKLQNNMRGSSSSAMLQADLSASLAKLSQPMDPDTLLTLSGAMTRKEALSR